MYDVAIIGAGICGSSLAFELSRYDIKVCLLEKENDVSMRATRANSAIIHAGYDPKPGTLMARYNVEGSRMAEKLCDDLSVLYRKVGSMVLAFDESEHDTIKMLYDRGVENGLKTLKILNKQEILSREPNLSDKVFSALYAPDCAIVSPWELCLGLAQIAVKNGVEIKLNSAVTEIKKTEKGFALTTDTGEVFSRTIINAAGVHADKINDMAGGRPFKILPSKGEYYLLDKSQGELIDTVVFQCPNKHGKGVLVAPTVHGNLIVGPNAEDCDADDTATTAEGLSLVRERAAKSVPTINLRENVRNFAGIRAISTEPDFIIGQEPDVPGYFNVAGIKSPGLSSAIAIAKDVAESVIDSFENVCKNPNFIGKRDIVRIKHLDPKQRREAIASNPLYGRVVCRCEGVTEGEVVDALKDPFVPASLAAVKRRCFGGSGRCQGGFCGLKIMEIICREKNVTPQQVLLDATGSEIVTSTTKGGDDE